MRHIPEKAEIDNGKLTKRKEPLIQGKYHSVFLSQNNTVSSQKVI